MLDGRAAAPDGGRTARATPDGGCTARVTGWGPGNGAEEALAPVHGVTGLTLRRNRMQHDPTSPRRVGMAVVGLGGAVATTAVAGLELLRLGAVGADGLPLADVDAAGLVPYESLVVGGWDLDDSDLAKAASVHGVLDHRQVEVAGPGLSQVTAVAGRR